MTDDKQAPTTLLGSLILKAHGIDPDQIDDLIVETSARGLTQVNVRLKPDAQNVLVAIVAPSKDAT